VKGRVWLILGVAAGIAIGIGKLAYLAGAAGSFSDTAQHVVGTTGLTIINDAAHYGASRRVVQGFTALLSVLVPGVTALLLVIAARLVLRLRVVIAVLVLALGVAGFFYLPHGPASGVLLLTVVTAGIALLATGPLVAAPLAALGALIGTEFLPRLVATHSTLPNVPVTTMHEALFGSPGSPLWLQLVVLVVAALPFAGAARLVLS
jgi:hypothetical protein